MEEEQDHQGVARLEEDLSNIEVSAPRERLLNSNAAVELCPESYRVNSPDEVRLLAIADNFQHQYSHLCPNRKPLLLCPINECSVKKFVSTTLRPTPTKHPELFTWEGCASFVSGFLSLDPLEPPVELPRYLSSPTSVLRSQRANCFEFASLLCSLLLGSHYDAYCVSGYAVKEICELDQSLVECPLVDAEFKGEIVEQETLESKYSVKPPRQLQSYFVTQQEKKKRDAEAEMLKKQELQEESKQRPADPLRGLRVHCWVLVLSGSRSIQENFFIDPLTGTRYATDDENFLGIESVWNNLNYYINMQDCRNGCTDLLYDLGDLKMWEPLLYGATSKKQLILDVSKRKERKIMSKINYEEKQQPQVFEIPRSWVSYINISKEDLESRWPGGKKVSHYRKAVLEMFSPFLRSDGLVKRLTTYKDVSCTEVIKMKEWYQHRNDHLKEREVNKVDNITTERFRPGRRCHLLFHRYTTVSPVTYREMVFSNIHVDNLVRRVVSQEEMTEFFEGRSDLLYCRQAVFEDQEMEALQRVVEHFHRNRAKAASEDVAERVFLLAQRRFEVTYHLEDQRAIPSRRSFRKPKEATEREKEEDFKLEMVSCFQVDPCEKLPTMQDLHKMLLEIMVDEKQVCVQVRQSVGESKAIAACREKEEQHVKLDFSPWTTAGAANTRRLRQEMDHLAMEEQRWLQENENDFLAPCLIRHNNGETLSAEAAMQLHQDCLTELKQRLEEQANLIQERYEKEAQELQQKQRWYQKNQLNMSDKEVYEYQAYCSKKTLQIHVAKTRLGMHKETAQQKYRILDQKLKRDPRLAPHLLSLCKSNH